MNIYQKTLKERKNQHLSRVLPLLDESGVDFYSNDYLGFAQSKKLKAEITQSFKDYARSKNGATGSRLLSGNSILAEQVEQQIAEFHNAESALIYPSGYTANLGLISCLALKGVTLLLDEWVHASIIDGARLGRASKVRFKHNDLHDIEEKLKQIKGQKIVVVESVYSMDGDIAPLNKLTTLCRKYEAELIVDEAHAIGVFGAKGEGIVQQLGLEKQLLARVMTFGKAPGIHGAAVVGPQWLKEYQINFSRAFIFSTAPSDHQMVAISCMYKAIAIANEQRKTLADIVEYFVKKRKNEHNWLSSFSHIQSLLIPGNEQVIATSKQLQKKGINVLPIRKPSVPERMERIRFCLHAYNKKEEIDLLFDALKTTYFMRNPYGG